MPTTTLVRPETATPEQIDLIKRTLAPDATSDELQLFLYDNARQGVNPLDKLIHFTKRGNKYTPITSIDFMRMRAADSGEYAGNDDAVFEGPIKSGDFQAHVTVYRFVQGQRCAFAATARWAEYCPGSGQDHMWRKMPHTMLAKCAEALALRKGFPRQLAGLYAKEEFDQAEFVDAEPAPQASGERVYTTTANPAPAPDLPPGTVRVERIDSAPTKKNPKLLIFRLTLSTGEVVQTFKSDLVNEAEAAIKANVPVIVTTKATPFGTDLVSLRPYAPPSLPLEEGELSADDIPF